MNLCEISNTTQKPAIAVIGSGYWGKNIVRNFYQLGALKLICDKNETLIDQIKGLYPGVETCIALNDVLSRDDINAVVIATPADKAAINNVGTHSLAVEVPLNVGSRANRYPAGTQIHTIVLERANPLIPIGPTSAALKLAFRTTDTNPSPRMSWSRFSTTWARMARAPSIMDQRPGT